MSDTCRRLDKAAAFMEQGKAVFVPSLLLSAKAEIEAQRSGYQDVCATLAKAQDEIARLRGGWLRVIQTENECRATGLPCAEKCGCLEEQEELAKIEDVVLG